MQFNLTSVLLVILFCATTVSCQIHPIQHTPTIASRPQIINPLPQLVNPLAQLLPLLQNFGRRTQISNMTPMSPLVGLSNMTRPAGIFGQRLQQLFGRLRNPLNPVLTHSGSSLARIPSFNFVR